MRPSYVTFLRTHRARLSDALMLDGDFIDMLLEKDVITKAQLDKIEADRTRVAREKGQHLLSILEKRRDRDFKNFCLVLKDNEGEVGAAELLINLNPDDYQDFFGGSENTDGANSYQGATSTEGSTPGATCSTSQGESSAEDRRERFRNILKKKRPQLVQELNINVGLLDYLIRDGVMNQRMKNILTEKGTKEDQATGLLEYIYTRPIEDMDSFLGALRANNQAHQADLFL